MRQLSFQEFGSPYSKEEIEELEARLGFRIPVEVADFLGKHNGGSLFYYEIAIPGISDSIDLAEVFGIGKCPLQKNYSNIESELILFGDSLARDSFPIGYETYGNLFIVRKDGSVLYWDHTCHYSDSKEFPVAKSFTEFIDKLVRVDCGGYDSKGGPT